MRLAPLAVSLAMLFFAPMLSGEALASSGETEPSITAENALGRIADDAFDYLKTGSAYVRFQEGEPVGELDPLTLEFAEERAATSAALLARLDEIDDAVLSRSERILAESLRHRFTTDAQSVEYFWLEPVETPYAVGYRFNGYPVYLQGHAFDTDEDLQSYLRLVESYGDVLDQLAARIRGRVDRGYYVSKAAIPGAVSTFRNMQANADALFVVSDDRLGNISPASIDDFRSNLRRIVQTRIDHGFSEIIRIFDDTYQANAPDAVGIGQYPGGEEYYRHLIQAYSGLEMTPREISRLGRESLSAIHLRMEGVRKELGAGEREEFHARLRADEQFIADTAQDVEGLYEQHVARMAEIVDRYFSLQPQAAYGVQRLDPASEIGMTYGYYQPPSPADPTGYYRYNGSDLQNRTTLTAAHLIFHELVPGHHFQASLQQELVGGHPVLKYLYNNAFGEGWAEYAASLGDEMGLYEDPYDLYGHLVMRAFLTSRLVLDTGMNVLGMSLEEARAYMAEQTFESDTQIRTETLRYSTDIPGQALGYALGYEMIWKLRRDAESALGEDFDVRDFHSEVIGYGSMPLNVLERHISDWIEAQR